MEARRSPRRWTPRPTSSSSTPRDAFVNSAGSLRALAQRDWAGNAFFPFGTLLTQGAVVRDRAVSADPGGVTLASGGRVEAAYLVLASGSRYAYPAKPVADSAHEALEDLRRTHKELAGAASVLIVGAGPVGRELAGEIKEVWPHKQVTIVHPAEQLLPARLAGRCRSTAHPRWSCRRLDDDGQRVQGRRPVHRPLRRAVRHRLTPAGPPTKGRTHA